MRFTIKKTQSNIKQKQNTIKQTKTQTWWETINTKTTKQHTQKQQKGSRGLEILSGTITQTKKVGNKQKYNNNTKHNKTVQKADRKWALFKIVMSEHLDMDDGGEEFVCVLPDTDLAGAEITANTLRKSVNALKVPHEFSNVTDHVTVSIGAAAVKLKQSMKPEELVKKADNNLYEAKESGRDRMVAA